MQNINSTNCNHSSDFQYSLYSTTFIIIFVLGLLTNSIALWVLCSYKNKKNKAIIFMINLAFADLAHVLSLPLRIHYYIYYTWPFGRFMCLLCFYLKYLNMYASIFFLTAISVQRYFFTTNPFKAKDWKRRYDVAISAVIWIIVGGACLPFPLLRNSGSSNNNNTCFADLGLIKPKVGPAMAMLTVAEMAGFIIPMTVIIYCTLKTKTQLKSEDQQCHNITEKHKALRMVTTCAVVFFICFAPYHINFFFYIMLQFKIIEHCGMYKFIMTLHPYTLCLASINCCLDPILYFFTAKEFQNEAAKRGSTVMRGRLMSRESSSFVKE
ncbi:P2Y receptor family member 10 L homeolog [Xenopus laevis]|uniref:LOC495152 protein n=1 Tax=Xenopus laevis TaxID=8355 RepID=Q5XGS6_XENLA|nr:P2Y receptor family member 10 L homeolog [Xenopus laevis]AAH84356.1 LOC495152 protein [Xenopus laevis]